MTYQTFAMDFLPAAALNVALIRLSAALASGERILIYLAWAMLLTSDIYCIRTQKSGGDGAWH